MYADNPTTMHRTWRHMGAGAYTCGSVATSDISSSIATKFAEAPTFAKALNARPPRRGVPLH